MNFIIYVAGLLQEGAVLLKKNENFTGFDGLHQLLPIVERYFNQDLD